MALEEQILRFYLKVFSFLLIFLIYFLYIFLFREINLKNDYFFIKKNENYKNIITNNIVDNNINLFLYKLTLRTFLYINNEIHFGKFELKKNSTYYQILKLIVLPSNVYDRITIVEGWSKDDLNIILSKKFDEFSELNYDFSAIELIGTSNVDDQKVYEIKITDNKTEYYSIESGLKLKEVETTEVEGNVISVETTIKEYEEVDGIMIPSEINQITPGLPIPGGITINFNTIKLNVKTSDSDFN